MKKKNSLRSFMAPEEESLSYYIAHPRKIVVEKQKFLSLKDVVRIHICAVMDHTSGNKRRAAKILGMTERTLYNHISRYMKEGTLTYKKEWRYFIKIGTHKRKTSWYMRTKEERKKRNEI